MAGVTSLTRDIAEAICFDQVIAGIAKSPIDAAHYPQTAAYNDGWRDGLAALRDELERDGGLTS